MMLASFTRTRSPSDHFEGRALRHAHPTGVVQQLEHHCVRTRSHIRKLDRLRHASPCDRHVVASKRAGIGLKRDAENTPGIRIRISAARLRESMHRVAGNEERAARGPNPFSAHSEATWLRLRHVVADGDAAERRGALIALIDGCKGQIALHDSEVLAQDATESDG